VSNHDAPRRRRPVRVVLANDSELVIAGLAAMLEPFRDRVVVVGVGKGDPGIVIAPEEHGEVDVLLLDSFSRAGAGLEAAAMVLSQDAGCSVVVFTEDHDERLVLRALRLGVSGYLLKSTPADALVDALERIADGEVVIDHRLASKAAVIAVRALDAEPWPGSRLGLTRREGEVLLLLADGISPSDVAKKLSVSRETVHSHLKAIYQKLGVNDRAAAVAIAWQEGVARRPPVETLLD
jgi:DNA-binding NarL/FixJ family response regulator